MTAARSPPRTWSGPSTGCATPPSSCPTADLYKNIAKVAAAGDNQVVFTLTKPNPFFLYDLSDNHAPDHEGQYR